VKRDKKPIVVRTIRGSAPRPGTNIPGDILINSTQDKPNWFPRREWRNQLVGAGLTGEEPYLAFIGLKLIYEEVTIDQADIDAAIAAGKEGVVMMLQGREVTFKKPGVRNINLEFDWSTINVAGLIDAVKLGNEVFTLKEKTSNRTQATVRRLPTTTTQEEVIEEPNDAPADQGTKTEPEMPEILKTVKTDAAGNHLNEDGSALSPEQDIAMKEWIAAQTLVHEKTNP